MPSIITHAAVPLALALAAGPGRISRPLLAAGIAASMLPDLDVLSFAFHIPYAAVWGHRGASHSLLLAGVVALLGSTLHRTLRAGRWQALAWLLVCAASHPLLDTLTSGGMGVALWWPWLDERVFAPWRPIRVSPLANRFFSARGAATLASELRWVWLPLFVSAGLWRLVTGVATPARQPPP
jgi:inner membrane protein